MKRHAEKKLHSIRMLIQSSNNVHLHLEHEGDEMRSDSAPQVIDGSLTLCSSSSERCIIMSGKF